MEQPFHGDDHLDAILSRLDAVKKAGGGWLARCPAHEDKSPSLSVKGGAKGVVMYCYAGCSINSIREALNVPWSALFYEGKPSDEKPVKAIDRRGMELEAKMCAERLQFEAGVLSKAREVRGWAKGALRNLGVGWDGTRFTLPVYDAEGKCHDVLLYDPYSPPRYKMLAGKGRSRLPWPAPEAVEFAGHRHVFVVEGEGTAISMASLGLPCVALPGAIARASGDVRRPGKFEGVGWHSAWAKRLVRFPSIILIPDCDEVGRQVMMTVAYDVEKAGGHVTVADFGLGDGFDAGDFLKYAKDLQSRTQAKRFIHMLADTARRQPGNIIHAQAICLAWIEWMTGGKQKREVQEAIPQPAPTEELAPLWDWAQA